MGYSDAVNRVQEIRSQMQAVRSQQLPTAAAAPAFAQHIQAQMMAPVASSSSSVPTQLYGMGPNGGVMPPQYAWQYQQAQQAQNLEFVTGDLEGMNPQLKSALNAIGRELGQKVDVISGNRTYEEQAALYQKYLNGTGNLAAPPGSSNHEGGNAADVYVGGVALANIKGGAEIARKYGVHFPVGGEPWHAELVGT